MPKKEREEVFEFVGSPLPPRFEDIPPLKLKLFCMSLNEAVLQWKREKEAKANEAKANS